MTTGFRRGHRTQSASIPRRRALALPQRVLGRWSHSGPGEAHSSGRCPGCERYAGAECANVRASEYGWSGRVAPPWTGSRCRLGDDSSQQKSREGEVISLVSRDGSTSAHSACVGPPTSGGARRVELSDDPLLVMAQCGHVPLPPYISRPATSDDEERYQTVFADEPGAVAAPTASLHLTTNLLRAEGEEWKSTRDAPRGSGDVSQSSFRGSGPRRTPS